MTIEITRDDLLALAEAAEAAPGSMMLMLKTTDGKRCTLLVTAPERRRRKLPVAHRLDELGTLAAPEEAREASAD